MADDSDSGVPQIPSTSFLIKELENQERRFNEAIKFYKPSDSYCLECGHSLNYNNYVLHFSIHIEETKKAKKKLLDDQNNEEQVKFEMDMERDQDVDTPDTNTASHQEPPLVQTPVAMTPLKPPSQEDHEPEGTIQSKIDSLQKRHKTLSRHMFESMKHFHDGRMTQDCPECQELLVSENCASHYRDHITDLNSELETLKDSKAKRDEEKQFRSKAQTPKKKLEKAKTSKMKPPKVKAGESLGQVNTESRLGTEEERKKMYRRIYGRKKYQYRIQNRDEEVRVTEEEIDAEIMKSSQRTGTDSDLSLTARDQLRSFVSYNSAEYKHEFKKARDRLYRRKLRELKIQGTEDRSSALNIPRAEIEANMLAWFTKNKVKKTSSHPESDPGASEVKEEIGDLKLAGKVKKEMVDPESTPGQASEPTMHEVRVKIESEQEEGLELGLLDNMDMRDLITGAEFTSMDTIVSAVQRVGDRYTGQN